MSDSRFTFRVAVFVVLIRDGKILLQRRFNTGWEDGNYSFISGHVEENEKLRDAGSREALEEAGVKIKPDDLEVVHIMHNNTDSQYINFFLVPKHWEGEPNNCEPQRCDDLSWFPLSDIPNNTLYFLKEFLKLYNENIIFSEFGF